MTGVPSRAGPAAACDDTSTNIAPGHSEAAALLTASAPVALTDRYSASFRAFTRPAT